MNVEPTLPLPVAVIVRLQTAETLRAEIAGLTAERDELRTELQTAAWERDTAQCEAAYLRDEVLHRDPPWSSGDPRVGRLLTMGDEPPPPPENGADIVIVSLSTGEVYVRAYPHSDCQWSKYGQYSSSSDFVTLAERGPWVTVDGWRYRDHKERAEAHRKLYSTIHAGVPGTGPHVDWPKSTDHWRTQLDELQAKRFADVEDLAVLAAWIEAWRSLALGTRSAWAGQTSRFETLRSRLHGIAHEPEWTRVFGVDGDVCEFCLTPREDHVTAEVAS